MEDEQKSRIPWPFVAGMVVVLLLGGAVYFGSRLIKPSGGSGETHLPFGSAEQAYTERIHFLHPAMSQAMNFLNQEFTYISGEISNDGTQTIRAMELTLEFRDPFNQLILREMQRVVTPQDRALAGGQRQPFTITIEHIPAEWNQQYPSIRVTGLVLE